MNKLYTGSRLELRAQSLQSFLSDLSFYSDYGKRYSDYYFDDDDDDATDSGEDSSESEDFVVKKEHNAVSWVLVNEAYCFEINKFAERLVDATFIEAKKMLEPKQITAPAADELLNVAPSELTASQTMQQMFPQTSIQTSSSDISFSSNLGVTWPKISEFNIKLGLEKLEDYMATWERSRDWMFCVEFLGFECEDSSNVFVYEVEWSKPTPEYPIPQVTASVYFALEVFKIVPYNYDRSIEVTYIFEGSNLIHYPGRIDFQEKWLEDILTAKLKFFKAFNFAVPKGFCDTKKTLK